MPPAMGQLPRSDMSKPSLPKGWGLLFAAMTLALVACGGSDERPDKLPEHVGFSGAIYKFDGSGQLPDDATKVGTTRGGGNLYGPAPAGKRARAVWVTLGGETWRYTYLDAVN